MSNQELELRKFVVPEIITGENASRLIARYLVHFESKRPLIVTDKIVRQQSWFVEIEQQVHEAVGDFYVFDDVTPNPKDHEAMKGAEIFLANECDLIIAIGGGSPMDAAKCISIVSTNGGHILDYEGVDQINLPGPPLICIPTTAGTAADISQFAIINDTESKIKKAIISKMVVPDLALIDPMPLMTMDAYLTACTGMDVLTHAIEAYVSNAHSTLTDIHALEGIRLVNAHLESAVGDQRTVATMYHMMIASTQAGMAFSNASLGAVHAMAHSLGGLLDLAHGECNSILLEHVIKINFDSVPKRYTAIASAMGIATEGESQEEIRESLLNRISSLRSNIGIPPRVSVPDLTELQREALIEAALSDPCIITNPKELTESEVGEIFDRIIQTSQEKIQ